MKAPTPYAIPAVPELALAALLIDDRQPNEITIRDASPTHPSLSIVERGNRQLPTAHDPAVTSSIIKAMLAHHPADWTINGTPLQAYADGPDPRAAVITERPSPQGWVPTTVATSHLMPILVNCIINGVLTNLPGLESLPKRYLSADPNPTSPHWSHVNRVAIVPAPRVVPHVVALDTQMPLHDTVREKARSEVQRFATEGSLQIHTAENATIANPPPEPIDHDAHVFLRAYQNHPRELGRQRPDVLPAIVHSTPLIIRTQDHSWAEQVSMIAALEAADSELVPVIATFQAPAHHEAHRKAVEARPDIDPDNLNLMLHLPHGQVRNIPMNLLAQGRYRPGGPPDSHLSLSVREPERAEPHELRQFLVRCFQPDLNEYLRQQPEANQAAAALTLAHQADHTVAALLQSRRPRQHHPTT